MQARIETMTVENDAAQVGPTNLPAHERRPRFKLIKLEERIAPGGIMKEPVRMPTVYISGLRVCTVPTATNLCTTTPY
jgi:hypothetical protein